MKPRLQNLAQLVGLAVSMAHCVSCENKAPSSRAEPAVAVSSAKPVEVAPKPVTLPRVENVVLITVDALRADQPWTGYSHIALPNLSRLAQESTVFTHVYSVANLTTASINGMLASRYPSELVRDTCTIGGFAVPDGLAVTLRGAQVQTVAAHGHAIFAGSIAPSAGFDTWSVIRGAAGRLQQSGAVTGADIAKHTVANFELARPERRFFSWTHFVDPHEKYVQHSEYRSTAEGDRGRYDSEVAYTDAQIGLLIEALKRLGMMEKTAIILSADHGEAFGEHGNVAHGFTLYEEELRVPLMIRMPGGTARRIDTPRSTLDIAPTIAELLGATPPKSWRGTSLLADVRTEHPEKRPVIVDVPAMAGGRLAMQVVIRENQKVTLVDGVGKAYDLVADPLERAPLSGAEAERAIEQARRDVAVIQVVPGSPCRVSAPRPQKEGDI